MILPVDVLLVEDHAVVREGLRALLNAQHDMRVVGEISDGTEVVETVMRLKPSVVVMDLGLPGMGGLDAARLMTQREPSTRIVILSMYDSEAFVVEALSIGVLGYVLKSSGGSELLRAIREVAAGRRFLSETLSQRAIDAYVDRKRSSGARPQPGSLTQREQEVLRLTVAGLTAAAAGKHLHISARTVETHRRNLMKKLDLHSTAALLKYAIREGLVPPV